MFNDSVAEARMSSKHLHCGCNRSRHAHGARTCTWWDGRHENANVVRSEITSVISNPCGSRLLDANDVLSRRLPWSVCVLDICAVKATGHGTRKARTYTGGRVK